MGERNNIPLVPQLSRSTHPEMPVRLSGSILVPQPGALVVGSALSAAIFIALGILVIFGTYAPRHVVVGNLIPQGGLTKVVVPRAGTIQNVYIKEGDWVDENQLVASISIEQSLEDGVGAQSRILGSLLEQEKILITQIETENAAYEMQMLRLRKKKEALHNEYEAIAQKRETLLEQRKISNVTLESIQKLKEQGYVSVVDVAARKQQYLDIQIALDEINRIIVVNKNAQADLIFDEKQLPGDHEQKLAPLKSEMQQISRQKAEAQASQRYSIVAPQRGRITASQMESGKFAALAQPLFAIIQEDTPLVAELFVESKSIGNAAVGQEVLIRYKSFPYEQYGVQFARIVEISQTAMKPDDWITILPRTGEPIFRVIAKLEKQTISVRDDEAPLQAGMVFDADILLDRRPLWRWLFEPIFAFKGRI